MTTPVRLGAPELALVRYGELALKGKNRGMFERVLERNIKQATKPISKIRIERVFGRIAVIPERRPMEVVRRIQDVFGVKSISPAWGAPNDPDGIVRVAKAVLDDALLERRDDQPITFRVRTRRADKRFPMQSTELDRYVAERIMPGPERLVVQLKDPELELGIDVREQKTFVFLKRFPGLGGLPVGTLGRALCLLSGGIDSPVAAWLTMKRGCHVGYVTFHSYPYIGEASKKKVVDLARALARYEGRSHLLVAPFTEVQTAIRDVAPEPYRTVLYRRMMQRIATGAALEHGYQALVTGESIGQVASQTLENITCIGDATHLPILRPLITFDKEETIEVARRIGTLPISNLPEPDCCTVFQPARPVIRGRVEECEAAESKLDVDGLVARALEGAETVRIEALD